MRTFVIGDVHGQLANLVTLLAKAGVFNHDGTLNARVIQLGDLGDFRKSTVEADLASYQYALDHGIEVLWGNHDYATQDRHHAFQGYADPPWLLLDLVERVAPQFAAEAHGFLLTHAGLHPSFMPPFGDAASVAQALNTLPAVHQVPVIANIGWPRGGDADAGGILWRDADREPLAPIPQVFGHTRGIVRGFGERRFCIDVGARKNHNLAGMWLPDMRVVAVGEDTETNEMALNGDLE